CGCVAVVRGWRVGSCSDGLSRAHPSLFGGCCRLARRPCLGGLCCPAWLSDPTHSSTGLVAGGRVPYTSRRPLECRAREPAGRKPLTRSDDGPHPVWGRSGMISGPLFSPSSASLSAVSQTSSQLGPPPMTMLDNVYCLDADR